MRVSTLAATILAIAAVAVAPSACKSNDIAETNSTTNVGGSTVGASGGIVKGPDGVELRIPAGALTKDVTFSIAVAATGEYPPLPGDFNVAGSVYALTPHGQKFLTPVVLSLPDPGGAGTTAILLLFVLLLFTGMSFLIYYTCRLLGLNREDLITAYFCSVKKTLAMGVPLRQLCEEPAQKQTRWSRCQPQETPAPPRRCCR